LYSDHVGHEGAQPLWVDKVEVAQEGVVKVEHYAWSGGWRKTDRSYLITGSLVYIIMCVTSRVGTATHCTGGRKE